MSILTSCKDNSFVIKYLRLTISMTSNSFCVVRIEVGWSGKSSLFQTIAGAERAHRPQDCSANIESADDLISALPEDIAGIPDLECRRVTCG
jgi:hypothetical protein